MNRRNAVHAPLTNPGRRRLDRPLFRIYPALESRIVNLESGISNFEFGEAGDAPNGNLKT